MNKEIFLKILKESLIGEISELEVYSNLQFYSDYIDEKLRKGGSEEEIFESLGDPRLIAKTIIETSKTGTKRSETVYTAEETVGGSQTDYKEHYGSPKRERKSTVYTSWESKFMRILLSILGLLIAGGIIFVLLHIVSAVIAVFFPLIIVLIILFLIRKGADKG
jgi:type IV secretory pathway VirB6-like protein